MSALIEVVGLKKRFGEVTALDGIDLSIPEGEFFSLLGPSGCGKTTLLRAIAGFEAPTEGRVEIAGDDMTGVPPNRRPTNMVFQSYAVFPHLSVGENVGFGLRRRDDLNDQARRELVADALDMVGMDGMGSRRVNALSGGQRQRVALARALVLRPRVLLLDEPLSALDKKLREQMQNELRRLQRHVGITFVLVTHDQEEALIMSDRIAVMFDGRIAQADSPQTLYRRPGTRQVAAFVGAMSFLPGQARDGTLEVAGLGRADADPALFPQGAHEGDVVAGLRPELLTVLDENDPAPAREAEGKIAEVTYYGDMTYYQVGLDGVDQQVTISMKNLVGGGVRERGERVRIGWDPRALVVFPA